jgi:hypothetical protein
VRRLWRRAAALPLLPRFGGDEGANLSLTQVASFFSSSLLSHSLFFVSVPPFDLVFLIFSLFGACEYVFANFVLSRWRTPTSLLHSKFFMFFSTWDSV